MFGITRGGYIWLPILACAFLVATLLGLLLLWVLRDNHRRYEYTEATIVFISDAGAAHKALFIPGCACVFVFYTLTLIAERWLRHARRIPGTVRPRERRLDIATVVCGIIGGLFLVLLSIFDAFNYSGLHWSFAVLFIVFVAISAVCNSLEVIYLHTDHPERRHLLRSAILKGFVVGIAVLMAIAFAALYGTCRGKATDSRCNTITSAAGVMEWSIAFILAFYFLTFVPDFIPAAKTSPRHQRHLAEKGLLPHGAEPHQHQPQQHENGSAVDSTPRDMSEAGHVPVRGEQV